MEVYLNFELDDLIHYKKMCTLTIKTFKKKKRDWFKNFTESINFQVNSLYIWNKVFKNCWIKITSQYLPDNVPDNHVKMHKNWIVSWKDKFFMSCKWSLLPFFLYTFFRLKILTLEFNIILAFKRIKSSAGWYWF